MTANYQVIARRWRPKDFDDIVGQDHIVRTLKNAIETGRIAHAYLFVGPRGTGKTSTARVFAKALNAEGGPSVHPDPESEISQAIMSGNCMDVIEIDGASNNSVDQVRDLREDCLYAPAQCTYKIYIIDEVHMLSSSAFNALLKTLEEPPSHVKFIFATTEAQKVLDTITSRCQRFEFRPIPDRVIVERLQKIAESENIEVEAAALASIARLAKGGMRDSQSILDQMISFCGTSIEESDVLDVYGLVSAERVHELAKSIVAGAYPAIIENVERFVAEGRDLYQVLQDLQAEIRETLIDAIGRKGSSARLGEEASTESLMRILDVLQSSETQVQRGLSEKVNFEVALLKAVEASRTRAIDTLIKDLSGLADRLPEEGGAESEKKKRLIPAAPELTPVDLAAIRQRIGTLTSDRRAPKTPCDPSDPAPAPDGGIPAARTEHDLQVNGTAAGGEAGDGVVYDPDEDPDGYLEDHFPDLDLSTLPERFESDLPETQGLGLSVEDAVAQLPEEVREVLKDQLRGVFKEVRPFNPKQMPSAYIKGGEN